MGFVCVAAVDEARNGDDRWRYPEYLWGQWLPGLQRSRRTDVTIREFWLQATPALARPWITDEVLVHGPLDETTVETLHVVGLNDSGRISFLTDAVACTPLRKRVVEMGGHRPLTLIAAQRLLGELPDWDDCIFDDDSEYAWGVAALRVTSPDRLGEKRLQAPVAALVGLAASHGLDALAIAGTRAGSWLQFALVSPEDAVRAECFIGDTHAVIDVILTAAPERSYRFDCRIPGDGSPGDGVTLAVRVVSQLRRSAFRVHRLLGCFVLIVEGVGRRPLVGRGFRSGDRSDGPLSQALPSS